MKSSAFACFIQFTPGGLRVKSFKDKIAFVTGAGSGIGRATAIALAGQGARLALADIDGQSAGETAAMIRGKGGEAKVFELDVADPGQIERTAADVSESFGPPAILVNNAGIAVGAYFSDTSAESWERIIAINLMGVVHCCRAFVPVMTASGAPGQIVNIASMLGYVGTKGVSAYCATKFGVVGFSECLRAELADQGIGVTAICPGVIRTNIINRGVLESREEDIEAKRKSINAFYEKRNYPPEKVARAIINSIRKNRAVVPVAPEAWVSWYAMRWAPWLVRWLPKRISSTEKKAGLPG